MYIILGFKLMSFSDGWLKSNNGKPTKVEKIADMLPVSGASTVLEWTRGGINNYEFIIGKI